MSLGSGTRLGPYEILAPLGAGGMGEVYEARDTRLGRAVAIKVLPPEFAADPDRCARFQREAKAIAALSHPHICALFDIGEACLPPPESAAVEQRDGRIPSPDSRTPTVVTVRYLVMEYLEGETLAQRLARAGARTRSGGPPTPPALASPGTPAPGPVRPIAPLPLDETLRIGAELAEALAAAHKAGIVHRDLKPGNVMLTPAGTKVLDFGLARLRAETAASDATSVATRTLDPLTDAGTRVGTVPYMAPEQVEGKEADGRSDIFALGAVLYEMATGHRAFEGESAASVAAAILDREPEPVTTLQPLTPPAFEHVVSACLAKDPEARWQAASDVARELRWIADERRIGRPQLSALAGEAANMAAGTARSRLLARVAAMAAAGLVLVAAAAAVAWLLARAPEPVGRPVRFTVGPGPAEEFADGTAGGMTNPLAIGRPKRPLMALSTDGDRLAFVAASAGQPPRLHIHDFARNTTDVLPGTDHAMSPVFSPDGRFLAFWTPSPAGALMKVPADGSGRPVLLCASAQPFGAAWTADGSIIFAEEWGPLLTVSASGGTPRAITQVAAGSDESHRLPHLLPDGRGVLFTVLGYSPFSIADWQNARVEALVPGRPERKVVLQGVTDARYLRTGHLLYGRRGVMEAVSFDLDRLEVTGGASVVLPDVMQAMNTGNTLTETGAVQVAVSPSGNLAYLAGGVPPLPDVADFIWIDRAGRLTPVGVPAGPYVGGSLSPGGKRLALRGYGAKPGLWVWDFERGVFQNLTTNSSHRWPLWTPDGGGLVYGSCERGRWELFLKEIEGHAPARTLASGFAPAAWGDEGRTLIFTSVTKPTAASGLMEQSDIWTLSMSGEQAAARAWLDSPANEDNPALSPDGHWLAYTSVSPSEDRSGAIPHIYVEAFPGHSSPRQVTDAAGGSAPVWSPDGKELFYVADCRNKPLAYCLCVCDVRLGGSVSFGRPREILELPGFVNTGPLRSWDTADGRTFIYLRERAVDVPATPPIKEMHVVLNWFDELKAKVPSK